MRVYFIPFFIFIFLCTSCQKQYQSYYKEMCSLKCELPEYSPYSEKIGVAVVLGGGGARGIAHVGVLEELENAGIPIDIIVGCSAGSLVGALYANHPCAQDLLSILMPLKKEHLLEINLFSRCYGLGHGDGLKKFLLKYLGHTEFYELKIPLIIVATELFTGEMICFNNGPIAPVVHASCAYPFFFSPVHLYRRVFVDGGVVDPVPVEVARAINADIVIAVDLCSMLPIDLPTNLFGVARRCTEIQFLHQSIRCSQYADIHISPEIGTIGTFDDCYNELLYEAGREAARDAIPAIRALLEKKKLSPND